MAALARECEVFTRYLTGSLPDPYVVEKYMAWHSQAKAQPDGSDEVFDHVLLAIASCHPIATTVVDGFSRLFRKNGLLRKKLIVLLAILEACAPSYRFVDSVVSQSRSGFFVLLGVRLLFTGIGTVVAMMALIPLQLICSLFPAGLARQLAQAQSAAAQGAPVEADAAPQPLFVAAAASRSRAP